MDEQTVLLADFQGNLPHGFNKGLGLNITDGTANFGDDHICICFSADPINKVLDLIGDVRNHLHRGAKVFSAPLLIQHVPVDLAGGQVGIFVEVFINEAFIVAKIQVGFSTVLGHIDLTVLVGTHCAGVNVDVGIQLLGCDLESTSLQQSSQGSGSDTLAKTGHNASGDKYVFRHMFLHPNHSTVTDLARFFGLSISQPFSLAT